MRPEEQRGVTYWLWEQEQAIFGEIRDGALDLPKPSQRHRHEAHA